MSTIELFASSILIAFTVGVIFAAVVIDLWCVRPLIRQQDDHREFWRDLANDRVAVARQEGRIIGTARHLGTPYRDETLTAYTRLANDIGHPSGKPGLRVVEGHRLYSADWLNDEAQA